VESGENANLCANVNCNDNNPCTAEHCEAKTGLCAYENQPVGVACSAKGACNATGACEEPLEVLGTSSGPTAGFFGLNGMQGAGAGLFLVGLVAGLGLVLLGFGKKKKGK